MDFNRNQFFIAGVLLLLLGIQFRMFDTFTLNEKATAFIASRTGTPTGTVDNVFAGGGAGVHKQVHPPSWLGWSLMSIGSVMILHSLAMKRPGG